MWARAKWLVVGVMHVVEWHLAADAYTTWGQRVLWKERVSDRINEYAWNYSANYATDYINSLSRLHKTAFMLEKLYSAQFYIPKSVKHCCFWQETSRERKYPKPHATLSDGSLRKLKFTWASLNIPRLKPAKPLGTLGFPFRHHRSVPLTRPKCWRIASVPNFSFLPH